MSPTKEELTDALRAGPDPSALAGLRARLAYRAEAAGRLDVAYRSLDTPIGALLLAATTTGLVRVAFSCEDDDRVLAELAERISPRLLHAPARLDRVARQLDEYFAGRRREFEVELDFALSHGYRLEVLQRMREIGYGDTVSYSGLAAASGRPRAVRAVGSACATNPLPVVVPCHRVLRSDGSLGGYGGGLATKRTLLDLEAHNDRP